MEMIAGSKITGLLWPALIVDWALGQLVEREGGGDFSGLYKLAEHSQ